MLPSMSYIMDPEASIPMASHGNMVITFTSKSTAQSNNLCKNKQLNTQYNMFIFTLPGPFFKWSVLWKLLQNAERKLSESTNNDNNSNNPYHQQSQMAGILKVTNRGGKMSHSLQSLSCWLQQWPSEWVVQGVRWLWAQTSTWHHQMEFPWSRNTLHRRESLCIRVGGVAFHDSKNKCYVFLEVKC